MKLGSCERHPPVRYVCLVYVPLFAVPTLFFGWLVAIAVMWAVRGPR